MRFWQKLVLALTPHDPWWCIGVGRLGGCGPYGCTVECRNALKRRIFTMPKITMKSRDYNPRIRRVHGPWACAMIGWCHDCDELPPPCCSECRAFGPCSECLTRRKRRDCGDSRCKKCATTYPRCGRGHPIPAADYAPVGCETCALVK